MTNLMIFTDDKMKNSVINARDLWAQLESKRDFSNWFTAKIIQDDDFLEGRDYVLLNKFVKQDQNSLNKFVERDQYGGQNRKDYAVTVETAIYLCISEGTKKGKEIRRQIVDRLKNTNENIKFLNSQIRYWYTEYLKAKDIVYSLKLGTPDDPKFMKALAAHVDNYDDSPAIQRTLKINAYLLTLKRDPESPWIFVCMAQIWFEALGRSLDEFNMLEEFDLIALMGNFALWEKGKGKRDFDLYGKQLYFKKWGLEHRFF